MKDENKDFLRQALEQQKKYHEKELEIADERWKSNEKYRERYMDGYVEEKLSWEKDLIEKIEDVRFCKMIIMTPPKAKKMTPEQSAYNQALKDIIKIIKD